MFQKVKSSVNTFSSYKYKIVSKYKVIIFFTDLLCKVVTI